MITVPGKRGKMYADSTGKPIAVGDKIRFRGQIYTLEDFGPVEDFYGVATLVFKEKVHTDEVPHECNVDLVV